MRPQTSEILRQPDVVGAVVGERLLLATPVSHEPEHRGWLVRLHEDDRVYGVAYHEIDWEPPPPLPSHRRR